MRKPTEMELRVAAALRGPGAMCSMSEADALDAARAAIRAMREPSVILAGHWASWTNDFEPNNRRAIDLIKQLYVVWPKLIDAASPPETGA